MFLQALVGILRELSAFDVTPRFLYPHRLEMDADFLCYYSKVYNIAV
jgi:hypothetical protein